MASGYNRFKRYKGAGYSGMPIGRAHRWHYDQGEWRERKLTPDEWEIFYQTPKRRAAKAPEGSGAPTGTAYNWLIISHQRVDKLDANSYMTYMEGKKFKVAHKRADKDQWSAPERTQRKKVIEYLEQVVAELKHADATEPLPYSLGEHDHIYGLSLRTKAELTDMAKDLGITGISKMKREELLEAVKAKLDGRTAAKPEEPSLAPLKEKTKSDLYRIASERDISGRSEMSKAQLLSALKQDMALKQNREHRGAPAV